MKLSAHPNKSIDRKFYNAQFRYLARVLQDGEHIRYADEEQVPVIIQGAKGVLPLLKSGTDHVRVPIKPYGVSQVFVRKRLALDSKVTEHSILVEVASLKRFAHEHLISVYGSYLQGDSIYVLFRAAVGTNLKNFLSDTPKAFEVLPKGRRREILIQWPHCLANALAWLHSHQRPHGNVRPSAITVEDDFRVVFGSFEGSGSLSLGPKPEENQIEAYQYAAPERWRRAVTVQTKGPSKFSAPSGGRTSARSGTAMSHSSDEKENRRSFSLDNGLDPTNPNVGYSFMPTAKRNFSRLQIGKSDSASVISVQTETTYETRNASSYSDSLRTVRGLGYRSTRSSTPTSSQPNSGSSSSGARTTMVAKAAMSNSLFVADPEFRTAVVQTWKSAQHDMFAADVFSLGAVIMSILTLLCKRTAGSFERHRSAKNRTAGRGGGLADASFHSNISQILLWADVLHDDAKKQAKKDDGQVFKAVGPILQVVRRCIEREPAERITAKDLVSSLKDQISSFAGVKSMHCDLKLDELANPLREEQTPTPRQFIAESQRQQVPPIVEDMEQEEKVVRPPKIKKWHSNEMTSTKLPTLELDSSLSSLGSFDFDDGRSETAVTDSYTYVKSAPSEAYTSRPVTADSRKASSRRKRAASTPKTPQVWNNYHNNDSLVDPSLSVSPISRRDAPYQDHSSSVSSASDDFNDSSSYGRSFYLGDSRPSSLAPQVLPFGPPLPAAVPPPKGALPALPVLGQVDAESRLEAWQRQQNRQPVKYQHHQHHQSQHQHTRPRGSSKRGQQPDLAFDLFPAVPRFDTIETEENDNGAPAPAIPYKRSDPRLQHHQPSQQQYQPRKPRSKRDLRSEQIAQQNEQTRELLQQLQLQQHTQQPQQQQYPRQRDRERDREKERLHQQRQMRHQAQQQQQQFPDPSMLGSIRPSPQPAMRTDSLRVAADRTRPL